MRLLLLADLHLGVRLPGWGEHAGPRREAIRTAWRDAVNAALDPSRAVDAVLVAGNLFDSPDPEASDLDPVRDGLARLVEAGKPVVILPGSYDGFACSRTIYRDGLLPRGVRVVDWAEPEAIELAAGGETLHLYSFTFVPGRSIADPFRALRRKEAEGAHVGLVAAVLEGGSRFAWGTPRVAPEELAATGLDLVVAGGSRSFTEVRQGSTLIVDPGSPVGLGPCEAGDRTRVIAAVGPDGVSIEKEILEAAPIRDLTLDVAAGAGERFRTALHGAAAARVRLVGKVDRAGRPGEVRAEVEGMGVPVFVEDETELVPGADELRAWGGEESVPGRFLEDLRARRDAASGPEERRALSRAMVLGLTALHEVAAFHVD